MPPAKKPKTKAKATRATAKKASPKAKKPASRRKTPVAPPPIGAAVAAEVQGSQAGSAALASFPVLSLIFLFDRRGEVRIQATQSTLLLLVTLAVSAGLYYSFIGILLLPPFLLGITLVYLAAILRAAAGIHWRIPVIYPVLRWIRLVP